MTFHKSIIKIVVVLIVFQLTRHTNAHGCMSEPCIRGITSGQTDFATRVVNAKDTTDFKPHFPAGDKSDSLGAGKRSQQNAAGPAGWTLFQPLRADFRWRAGVCGDTIHGNDHLRGGKYYNNGRIVRTYQQGSSIQIGLSINAHHNGFIQLHLCNVEKCKGEISRDCFRNGHCRELKRSHVKECENGHSRWCGPIDPAYPGRFYLPCSRHPGVDSKIELFGYSPAVILYDLPPKLYGAHFVLQMYWTSANTCNPPGTRNYFTGSNRPKGWGNCHGQGGAKGGWSREQKDCGKNVFPEEYLQCADVAIQRKPGGGNGGGGNNDNENGGGGNNGNGNGGGQDNGGGNGNSGYDVNKGRNRGSGGVRDIVLIGDGQRIRSLSYGSNKVSVRKYKKISVEAITETGVSQVKFYVNNKLVRIERGRGPFYIAGKVRRKAWPREWKKWSYNRPVKIGVQAKGDKDETTVTFI